MIQRSFITLCFLSMLSLPVLAKEEQKKILPVTVAPPIVREVSDYLDVTGRVDAFQTVNLVARVPGYLEKVHFKDGGLVKKNQLLFTIEQSTYKQQLNLNNAELLKAQSEYSRQQTLIRENATSEANVEETLSERDQAAANTDLAKINLAYTEVRAPFDGRIGRKLVDIGNYVGSPSATKLAVIEQINPIYVYFNVSERDILRIRKAVIAAGGETGQGIGKAPVFVGLQNETNYPHKGTLDYVGTSIDQASGTMEIRALFQNDNEALIPGFFTRVRIPLGKPEMGVLIPDSAIQRDQSGFYIMTIDSDNISRRQAIKTGPMVEGLRVVTEGLKADQLLVIKGLSNASDGQKVAPEKAVITQTPSVSATPIIVNPIKK